MIYLDYAATSIKRLDVIKNLLENIEEYDGNTSSSHALGRKSKMYLEKARGDIAKSINANPKNLIFTSGATESNNTIMNNFNKKDYEIISTKIEHKSILKPLDDYKAKYILLDSDTDGRVTLEDVKKNITEKTRLVSVMYVNNETGIIQPIKEIGEFLKGKNIWFHVDAVQALGHVKIDVEELNCDSMSFSGHKIGAMHGFGVLYLKNRIKSLLTGGIHENQQRAGTTNVLGAISMAQSIPKIYSEDAKIIEIRDYFLDELKNQGINYEINGNKDFLCNHIVNLYFPFVKNDLMLTHLDMNNIMASAGSACNSGSLQPSYVIENMYDRNRSEYSIRFSFGYTNTKEEIDYVIKCIKQLQTRKS